MPAAPRREALLDLASAVFAQCCREFVAKPQGGGDILSGEPLYNEIANGKYTYETVVYGLAAGSYYIDMVNGGKWTVTFTPLQ